LQSIVQQVFSKKLPPATLRLTGICFISLDFTGADFSEENQAVAMKHESQLLFVFTFYPFIRSFPAFFHNYGDSGVTVDPPGNN
jgi:hypothetical protein